MIIMNGKYLFHVHTYRCRHAEHIPDEAYIKRAVGLGAGSIWFSDHAPFPGDPFGNRMAYAQLSEYLYTLNFLKQQYKNLIDVHVGLEIEYIPSFDHAGYYRQLRYTPGLEFLLLGQHMAELQITPALYTFNMSKEWLNQNESEVLGRAEMDGIRTGYFDCVAHPDRIFRRCKTWTPEMQSLAEQIVKAAVAMDIPLEQNESSKRQKHHYWPEFWKRAGNTPKIIRGLDAHAVKELKLVT